MQNNPVLDAIFTRRSIRRFTGEPLTREEVTAIVEAGRWAPSGLNNQPWRFLVIGPADPRKKQLEGATKYSHIIERCDTLVLVFLHRQTMYHEMKDHQCIGACLQNMLLAAHAQGLGGVWLGEIINQSAQVLDILGLSGGEYEFQAALAMGRPDQKGSSTRVELAEIMIEDY